MTGSAERTPVTVLTGYLGAGKTTLLNRILTDSHKKRFAVIVNEFGESGIDNELIVDADEEVIEMNNGCICCTVRNDLIRILDGLMKRKGGFDGIIVETTGLADPAPVAQTFFVDESVGRRTKLDAIVTVVDAKHVLAELDRAPEAQEQIAFADVLLLNKIDLVTPGEAAAVEARVRRINPYVTIHRTQRCRVDLSQVLGRDASSLDRILELEPGFLDDSHDHEHDALISSLSLRSPRPVDPARFFAFIRDVTQQYGPDMLRTKGILSFANDNDRYVFHGVHMLLDGDPQRPWRPNENRESRIVFIGRNLPVDLLRRGFDDCCL